jgi:hypothetical protein
MAAIFRTNPIEVDNRLEQLGWARSDLLEIIDAMVAARNGCTENDPAAAPGWMSWKEGVRRMREIARPNGLEKNEADQVPWVLDHKRGIRLTVSNTDDGTGIENRTPQNRSKKGPATDRAVGANQYSFIDLLDVPEKVVPLSMTGRQPGMIVSWYLCVYCEVDDVRAELSCPVGLEGGFFTEFMERIILIGPDGGGTAVRRRDDDPDEGPEFDVPVSRK